MFLISYHGGAPGAQHNNLHAYDDRGRRLSAGVLRLQPGTQLAELRGIYINQGYLYVVNGGKTVSDILCFSGSGTSYTQAPGTFASGAAINSLKHPFALAFAGSRCFVSNQDTNVVAMLTTASPTEASATTGAAASYLAQLSPAGAFLDGTFVASANGALPGLPPTTPVPSHLGGLKVGIVAGKVQHSVRDLVLAGPGESGPTLLFVADEPGNRVRLYDPATGQPRGVSSKVAAPTHLLASGDRLFVSAGNQILSAPLVSQPGASASDVCLDLQPVAYTLPGKLDRTKVAFSGMTVDAAGNFYVALRKPSRIVQFAGGDFTRSSLWLKCPKHASPEFILYVRS